MVLSLCSMAKTGETPPNIGLSQAMHFQRPKWRSLFSSWGHYFTTDHKREEPPLNEAEKDTVCLDQLFRNLGHNLNLRRCCKVSRWIAARRKDPVYGEVPRIKRWSHFWVQKGVIGSQKLQKFQLQLVTKLSKVKGQWSIVGWFHTSWVLPTRPPPFQLLSCLPLRDSDGPSGRDAWIFFSRPLDLEKLMYFVGP